MAEPGGEIRVVHRDGGLLVLDKPPGIATTAPGAGHSLTAEAQRLDPDAPALHASSRLDAEVSGLVTFARTRPANQSLLQARERGEYRRAYLALCQPAPQPARGDWRWSLAIDPRDKRRRVALEDGERGQGQRQAHTRYRVLAATPHACLLWLEPQTGRTHQLRVHAQRAGSPLLGDRHYGGQRRVVLTSGAVVTLRRVMLHCTRVTLPGLTLESLPRPDFLRAWEALGGAPIGGCLPADEP